MRLLRILLPVVALVAGTSGVGWYASTGPERAARRHREAVERWPDLVANGFRGDRKEIVDVFRACFRTGDPAAEYTALFATAQKEEYGNLPDIVQYYWVWDFGDGGTEGDALFQVYLEGSPPVIAAAVIGSICH
jgi:hypothetical protein